MSFLTDKKDERARLAIEAATARRFQDAYVHAAETARLAFSLAELSEGAMARAYLDDANGWVELTERLKGRENESNADAPEGGATAKETERAASPSSRWMVEERPAERFSDVAGLEDVKRIVFDDVINAAKYSDAYRAMGVASGGGALMYGPPGNGKTLIARAIAGELDAAFFAVSGALIKDKYVGETEKNMRRLFEEAARYDRAVVFIDEVHSLLTRRGNEKASAVDEFLVMADGFVKRDNTLLILGATNYPQLIDVAALRRFKNLIYVGMPDVAARRQILERQFKGVPSREPLEFDRYAAETEGYSGADIARVAETAKKTALRRMIEDGAAAPTLIPSDLESAIFVTKPTVSPATIQKYRDWEAMFYGDGGSTGRADDPDEV